MSDNLHIKMLFIDFWGSLKKTCVQCNDRYSSSFHLITKFISHTFFLSFFLSVFLFCTRARKDLLVIWEEMDRKDNKGRKECREHVTHR